MIIHANKIASVAKNVPIKKNNIHINRNKIISKSGNLLAVEAMNRKRIYNQIELKNGRSAVINKKDVIIVALGNRRALKGFAGKVPRKIKAGDIINILNFGGVAGICTSSNRYEVGNPLKVKVLGAVIDDKNKPINIYNYRIFEPAKKINSNIPIIIVTGTCMNVGKTTVACEIIKEANKKGLRVACAKIAGIAAIKDTLQMRDSGAIKVISMIDAGQTSTILSPQKNIEITKGAINYLQKFSPDIILFELGDGILGEYKVLDMISEPEIKKHIKWHVTCANDPPGALKIFEISKKINLPANIISGPITDNEVGLSFIKKNLKITGINSLSNGDKLLNHLLK